jgi:hypothetical protein
MKSVTKFQVVRKSWRYFFCEKRFFHFLNRKKKNNIGLRPKSNTSIQTRFNSHCPRATNGYFSQSEISTTAHSGGKNERNVDKRKQLRNVPGRTVCAGVGNMTLLEDNIMHVTTICKSDGISRTWVWTNFSYMKFTYNLKSWFDFKQLLGIYQIFSRKHVIFQHVPEFIYMNLYQNLACTLPVWYI